MSATEIVLPMTEPETEWVRGRALRKVSPTRDHSRLQAELIVSLSTWARGRGEVGPEWRLGVQPPGERRRPLVPDIAFVALERLRGMTHSELQAPEIAPDVAIEILSPGDDSRDVAEKTNVYLHSGSALVLVFDPSKRTLAVHDARGATTLTVDDTFAHGAMPGFELELGLLFATALDLPT